MTSPFFLTHPVLPWTLDLSAMGLDEAAFASLPWDRALAGMTALEAGAIANPDEERQVGHYWLRAPELAPTLGQAQQIGDMVEAVRDFAFAVRNGVRGGPAGAFTDVLHVGIGGSALGPALLLDALSAGDGLRVHFLDNTDPDGIARVLRGLPLPTTLVLVVSKSGGTPETRTGMLLVREALEEAQLSPRRHMVAITGEGSKLDALAAEEGWLARFPMWDWVGGRTSVTAAVGLLPAELAGIDTHALLSGAADMDGWTRVQDPLLNPAALLAGAWHLVGGGVGDRNMVVVPYSDRLLLLSRYLQQLVMESLGQRLDRQGREVHQGLSVFGNKGSTDQHAFIQQLRDGRDDFFLLFLQVLEDGVGRSTEVGEGVNAGDFLQGFLLGTRRALREEGRLSATLTVRRVDAYALGGLIALFERAVGLYAELIDINAYHQPGVEAGKKAAAVLLSLSRSLREEVARAPGTAAQLAERLGAEPLECWYILERLAATHRVGRTGDGLDTRYGPLSRWEI
ncbi:MAG: glucose-6-phosphate isomerase [Deltaproteobacteria bacterium]|nr:glucose-6-phosphate isomerase [Deltaproteobacteria bacterium]